MAVGDCVLIRAACVGAFVALVLTAGPAARATSSPVDGLTLEQQVGQLIVFGFPGTTPPAYVRGVLRDRRAAGVILFGRNIVGPRQLRELTLELRRLGGRAIIAVDQEGGRIRRLPWAPPVRSEPEQVAAGTVRSDATAAARALRAAGVTVVFAPVGDVPSVPGAAIADRAFSSDPGEVAAAVQASVRGWRAGGVVPTVKHFPGLGGATGNTDAGVVTIRHSRATLEAVELPPFRAAVAAGVPIVMVGHARYPALDRFRIASQSRPIMEGVLREELGFRGVVITDSMEARASLATGEITRASERAIAAGADLVLLAGRRSYQPVYDHLLAVARRSEAFRERVRESAARILVLKANGASAPR